MISIKVFFSPERVVDIFKRKIPLPSKEEQDDGGGNISYKVIEDEIYNNL